MRLLKLAIALALLFVCNQTNAQKKFSVEIQFPAHVKAEEIRLFYDNGQDDNLAIKPVLLAGKMIISKAFYSKYAAIIIGYKDHGASFWLTDKPATIHFFGKDSVANPLKDFKLTNAWSIDEDEGQKSIINYTKATQQDLEDFLAGNKQWFAKDSLIMLYEEKNRKVIAEKVNFVKKNGGSYYSFWLFRRELVYSDHNVDSLANVFRTAFSDSLQNSFEGKETLKRLTGRSLGKNKKAVDFTVTDQSGKLISLQDYRGKYVLLTFWASWCQPCVAEIPAIKALRQKYPANELEIIFVTLDEDSTKFAAAVKKYDLPWTHVFSDMEILKKYGVLAIPQVYLIDHSGTIVYSREEERDADLKFLTRLMEDKPGRK